MAGAHDFDIPIDQVHQMVTSDNMYVFVAQDNNFYAVDFDFQNTGQWLPFLTPWANKTPNPGSGQGRGGGQRGT